MLRYNENKFREDISYSLFRRCINDNSSYKENLKCF